MGPGMVVYAYNPSYVRGRGRRIASDISPMKSVRPYLKKNQTKGAGGMTQVVEPLPSKHKTLSSNPHTTKTTECMSLIHLINTLRHIYAHIVPDSLLFYFF
jgi:hypothetical protein